MKFAVLGQPCIDEIIGPDGSIRQTALGGILYSIAATERLLREFSPGDSFTALTWLSTPDRALLEPFLSELTRLDRSQGLWPTTELSNRVQLRYTSESQRTEHCSSILPALTPRELEKLEIENFDGIFVNMISGFDITLETFEWIRAKAPEAHLHLDIHALSLGTLSQSDANGFGKGRRLSPLKDWERWVIAADSVQLNESEAAVVAGPEYSGEERLIEAWKQSGKRDTSRARCLVITRAERGASLYQDDQDRLDFAAPSATPMDTTGSGDVFGAVFAVLAAQGVNLSAATQQAVRWATWNTQLDSLSGLLTSPLPSYLRA